MRRVVRIAGSLMIVAGVAAVAWVVVVWQWQDPFTALYTKYQQHKLAAKFAHRFADYRPPAVRVAALGDLGGATGAALLVDS